MNRSELRALAEAARVGGEGADWCAVPGGIWCCNVGPCKHLPRLIVRDEHMTPENRTFIAAADPSTVLALLDRLEAAEALLREQHADEGHHRSIGTLRGEECMFCGVPVPCAHNRTRAFLAEDTP